MNELKIKQHATKAYGVKRGVIYLDDKELMRTKIFKKYGCEIKEKFLKKCKIYLKYMHNFNFTFKDVEKNERLVIYYDESVKPNMLIVEYKNKYGTQLKKIRKTLSIGDEIEIKIKSYEDKKGEHLKIDLLGYSIEFNHLIRVMNIQCNSFFEIEVLEFDDDILFDI